MILIDTSTFALALYCFVKLNNVHNNNVFDFLNKVICIHNRQPRTEYSPLKTTRGTFTAICIRVVFYLRFKK